MNVNGKYPTSYEYWLTLSNGEKIFVRPILPSDKNLVIEFFDRLSPESVYHRFLQQLKSLPKDILYRFTHVNYPSEFALVGLTKEEGKDAIVAIARYAYITRHENTEFAVTVRDDWQHQGIGTALLKKVFDVAKENGITHFIGRTYPDNKFIMKILAGFGIEAKASMKNDFFEININL